MNVALGDTSPGQRIGLVGGILLGGGHTRVPDQHADDDNADR
ncbi:MAG: hypothetical protein WAL41_05065 [Mycobacterium sp.]